MNSKFLKTIGCLATALALTACSNEEMADSTQLPEGKYPVTFTATGLEISATTRATADGAWTKDDEVAVQIGSDVGKYTANSGGTSTTLEAARGVTPFYWQKTNEKKSVSAWYCGTGYKASLPSSWSVQTDQSSNNAKGYQYSDFLYAEGTLSFNGNQSLRFYHQVAKVVVNIRNYGVVSDASTINSVSIKAITDGTFTPSLNENNCGLSAKPAGTLSGITPNKLSSPNTNVVFEDEKNGETALASYQALVIPQALGTNTPIEIQIKGYDAFTYPPTGSWEGGTQYTYNLTIKGSEVTATVSTSIGWTESSATGEGSVEI